MTPVLLVAACSTEALDTCSADREPVALNPKPNADGIPAVDIEQADWMIEDLSACMFRPASGVVVADSSPLAPSGEPSFVAPTTCCVPSHGPGVGHEMRESA